jgi:transposase-like protein
MPDCGISSLVRIFDNAPDEILARQRARRLMEEWRSRSPELVGWMRETLHDPLAVFSLPRKHRMRMRTNNGLERFHEEIRRRTRVVRIFPNRMSCLRLCTALSMEQSEESIIGHRYLGMEVLEEEQQEPVELPIKEAVLA